MHKKVKHRVAKKRKTSSDGRMGKRLGYIQIPASEDLRKRFEKACQSVMSDRAKVGRALILAWVEQVEAGEKLIGPFKISESGKEK